MIVYNIAEVFLTVYLNSLMFVTTSKIRKNTLYVIVKFITNIVTNKYMVLSSRKKLVGSDCVGY